MVMMLCVLSLSLPQLSHVDSSSLTRNRGLSPPMRTCAELIGTPQAAAELSPSCG